MSEGQAGVSMSTGPIWRIDDSEWVECWYLWCPHCGAPTVVALSDGQRIIYDHDCACLSCFATMRIDQRKATPDHIRDRVWAVRAAIEEARDARLKHMQGWDKA